MKKSILFIAISLFCSSAFAQSIPVINKSNGAFTLTNGQLLQAINQTEASTGGRSVFISVQHTIYPNISDEGEHYIEFKGYDADTPTQEVNQAIMLTEKPTTWDIDP